MRAALLARLDDLLQDLEVTHPAGGAVSLLERQVAVLRDRNMDMRHRLSQLLDTARDNDHAPAHLWAQRTGLESGG